MQTALGQPLPAPWLPDVVANARGLDRYTLVSLADGGNLRLYERARGSVEDRVGASKK